MNRLVIIGNGFDLAHGLPTSYKDFIDDYWKDRTFDEEDNFIKFYELIDNKLQIANNYGDFKKIIQEHISINYPDSSTNFHDGVAVYISKTIGWKKILEFKNNFFSKVNTKNLDNWVDIENEYYYLLKEIVKSEYVGENLENKLEQVKKLNKEFENVKNLLEKYLTEKVENKYEIFKRYKLESAWLQFYNILKPISVVNNEHNINLEFNHKEDKDDINLFFENERKDNQSYKAKSFLLDFNYTSTLDRYVYSLKKAGLEVELNQIHGRINNEENKLNFGFGDEMDDDYKIIENINNNEFLRNFKTFQYLQNSNYSKLLSFIDSEKFQVLIVGHSCGLSDRTLLNTIFEHPNCRSIKVFYHQREDGTDNYTEITQNISRHFNKKKLMREKIVNKTLCQPLPQIQLPVKKAYITHTAESYI